MSRPMLVAGIVFIVACAAPAHTSARASASGSPSMEGTFEYVGTIRGQSVLTGGRFVMLYGPSNGSAPMTGEAGTYRISRDTATHTITYSSNPQRVGTVFLWTPVSWSGDTVTYDVMDAQRAVTGRGRSVRR